MNCRLLFRSLMLFTPCIVSCYSHGLSLASAQLDFGAVPAKAESRKTIQICNESPNAEALTIKDINLPRHFRSDTPLPATMEPDTCLSLSLIFQAPDTKEIETIGLDEDGQEYKYYFSITPENSDPINMGQLSAVAMPQTDWFLEHAPGANSKTLPYRYQGLLKHGRNNVSLCADEHCSLTRILFDGPALFYTLSNGYPETLIQGWRYDSKLDSWVYMPDNRLPLAQEICAIALDPSGRWMALVSGTDNQLTIRNSMNQFQSITDRAWSYKTLHAACNLLFNQAGNTLFTLGHSGPTMTYQTWLTAWNFNIQTGNITQVPPVSQQVGNLNSFQHGSSNRALTIDENDQVTAIDTNFGTQYGATYTFDRNSQMFSTVRTISFDPDENAPKSVSSHPSGMLLAKINHGENTVYIMSPSADGWKQCESFSALDSDETSDLLFSHHESNLAVTDEQGHSLLIYEIDKSCQKPALTQMFSGYLPFFTSPRQVAFSRDNQHLAVMGEDSVHFFQQLNCTVTKELFDWTEGEPEWWRKYRTDLCEHEMRISQ